MLRNLVNRAVHCAVRSASTRRPLESLERRVLMTVPVASNFNFNHDGPEQTQSLTVDFNVNVSPSLINSDLTLEKVNTDANVPASSIVLNYSGANPARFSFLAGAVYGIR